MTLVRLIREIDVEDVVDKRGERSGPGEKGEQALVTGARGSATSCAFIWATKRSRAGRSVSFSSGIADYFGYSCLACLASSAWVSLLPL